MSSRVFPSSRRNLHHVKYHGDKHNDGEDDHNAAVQFDDFREDVGGGLGDPRASFADAKLVSAAAAHDKQDPPRRSTSSQHSRLLTALSDTNSELARFLLANDDDEDDRGFAGLSSKSVRNMAVSTAGSMGSVRAWYYSLALEPMEVRRKLIIMLAEAYAIFGALFLSGTWVLYEWGSNKVYGGCNYDDEAWCHPAVDRAFELVMAMAITTNVFMAMFACFLWLMSILFSGNRSWVFSARKMMALIISLLICTLTLTFLGVGLAIYSKLAPYWAEFVIAFSFFLGIVLYGVYTTSNLIAEELSLEYLHFPMWFKLFIPFPMLKCDGRQQIREAAEKRAKELKTRAYQERTMLNPNASASTSRRRGRSGVGVLLRRAADTIGRYDFDVSKYEDYLEQDWYNDADELRSMSAEVLSKYMPRRLAEELHNQLKLDITNVRTSSIGSGLFEDVGREYKVSWNVDEESE